MDDAHIFRRVFELARKGGRAVSPNPLVGCVIVKNNKIIGEGYHSHFGGPHAEINALHNCSENPSGSSLYINLEPCSHYGKTPPCAPELIKAGIAEVVCCITDPNPLVSGKGIRLLEENNINVRTGIFSAEAKELNKVFLKYVTTGLPYVTVKMAQSIDGRIADAEGNSRWITGEKARAKVHSLRAQFDAVAVGAGTLIADDPLLSVRDAEGPEPVKIVFSRSLNFTIQRRLFDTLISPVRIYTAPGYNADIRRALENKGIEVIPVDGSENEYLLNALREIGKTGITTLMAEGGATLAGAFLKQQLADELMIFTSPRIIGNGKSSFSFSGSLANAPLLRNVASEDIDGDILTVYRPDSH